MGIRGHKHDGKWNRAFYWDGYYHVVGTCHTDVNELLAGKWPGGMPKPSIPWRWKVGYWKLSGNSERVERDIWGRWGALFGTELTWSSYDGKEPSLGSFQNPFFANKDNVFLYDKTWLGTKVNGKWWHSSGNATVLTVPPGKMPSL